MENKTDIQIYVDLKAFYKAFYQAQFLMPKRDRIELAQDVLSNISKAITCIKMANDIHQERLQWLKKAIIYWGIVISDMELINECKMLLNPKPENKVKNINNKIINLYELISRVDEGIIKWYKYTLSRQVVKTSN